MGLGWYIKRYFDLGHLFSIKKWPLKPKNHLFYYKKRTFWVFQLHFIHCLFGSLQVVSLHQLNEKGYNFFPVCTHMQEYVKTFNLSGLFVEF